MEKIKCVYKKRLTWDFVLVVTGKVGKRMSKEKFTSYF